MRTYEDEFEKFVVETGARWNLCLSYADPLPGKIWSKARNDSEFLLALQNVEPDKWHADGNMELWKFQHIGGELPH